MPEWMRHLVTGKDNATHDLARWSWITTTLATIAGAIYNAIHAGVVSLTDFAQAIGIISGAHGAAIWAKKDTEPGQK